MKRLLSTLFLVLVLVLPQTVSADTFLPLIIGRTGTDGCAPALTINGCYSCAECCTVIDIRVENSGDADMSGPTAYEVWWSAYGSPAIGEMVGSGTVPALGVGERVTIVYSPIKGGSYAFRIPAYGVWSKTCFVPDCPTQTPTRTRTPTKTPTPTRTSTATATKEPSQTPTFTEEPSLTPTGTWTPVPTETSTETATPTDTATTTETLEPSPSATSTYTPTATEEATVTVTRTKLPTPSSTPTATETSTATATRTRLPTPSSTPTATGTPTATSTRTRLPTPTHTPSITPTPTETVEHTPVPFPTCCSTSPTPSATNTVTKTATETNTSTPTLTTIPTSTATRTAEPSVTPTTTRTPIATATETQAPTLTHTPSTTPTATTTLTEIPTSTETPQPTPTNPQKEIVGFDFWRCPEDWDGNPRIGPGNIIQGIRSRGVVENITTISTEPMTGTLKITLFGIEYVPWYSIEPIQPIGVPTGTVSIDETYSITWEEITVPDPGRYEMQFRPFSGTAGGKIHLEAVFISTFGETRREMDLNIIEYIAP